ncbi:uncharacterized protein GJ701_001616 isoform 1-T1 [Geothlypis trichas]
MKLEERSFDWNCTKMLCILKMLWSDWHGVWIPGLDAGMLPAGTTATAVLSEGTQPLCPCVLSLCLEGCLLPPLRAMALQPGFPTAVAPEQGALAPPMLRRGGAPRSARSQQTPGWSGGIGAQRPQVRTSEHYTFPSCTSE